MSISKNVPASVVSVPFHGDTLEAVQTGDGKIMVSIKRVCESLGIDVEGQRKKLATCEWATTEFISAVAQDGKQRRLAMIDLESLPMWLATITASKVKAAVRPKLLQFQREAHKVLAAWFLGTCRENPALAAALADMKERLAELEYEQGWTQMCVHLAQTEASLAEGRASCGLYATGDDDTEYMTAKEFFELFRVRDGLGFSVAKAPAAERRAISRRIGDISRRKRAEVRFRSPDEGGGVYGCSEYRLDILMTWRHLHDLEISGPPESYNRIVCSKKGGGR